eukprot:Em0008g595a
MGVCADLDRLTASVFLRTSSNPKGKVKILYGSMDAAAFELSQSEHNRRTFNAMKEELAVQEYTSSIAHRAVRRHFETLKRAHRDSNAEVRPGEKALWEGLSVYYMTDESDNSDDGINTKHKLYTVAACMRCFDAFMETLDKRHESLKVNAGLKVRNEYSARPQRGLHRKNVPVTSSNVVEDPEEDERCISEEDLDPTNWNS